MAYFKKGRMSSLMGSNHRITEYRGLKGNIHAFKLETLPEGGIPWKKDQ
jgi:hypothetical protein